MKLKYSNTESVPLDEAKRRAINCLNRAKPTTAAMVANAIWPGHEMNAQGAGGAASRILRKLRKDGKADWTCVRNPGGFDSWGWIRTD